MRYTLSILAIALLISSCNSSKKEEKKPATVQDTISGPTPDLTDRTVKDTMPKDFSMEPIGALSLGLSDTKAIGLLGQPDSKTKELEWGADGLMHQEWVYKAKGITLNMSRDEKVQQIFAITVTAPSDLKTARGIGIGSGHMDVMKAYEKDIDKEESNDNVVVVGSIYGGIIFSLKGHKVESIFAGAAAE